MTRLLICMVLLACITGCGQVEVVKVREEATLSDAPSRAETAFGAEIVLCRRIGSKTGKRIAIGDSFAELPEKKNRYIHAFLDVANASVGIHQVHLVWVKPGGREMFRKSAEVTVAAADEGFVTDVVWFDAEDLHNRKSDDPQLSPRADFTLGTRLNVAPKKERDPGQYTIRVYWNRELAIDKPFTFEAPDRS